MMSREASELRSNALPPRVRISHPPIGVLRLQQLRAWLAPIAIQEHSNSTKGGQFDGSHAGLPVHIPINALIEHHNAAEPIAIGRWIEANGPDMSASADLHELHERLVSAAGTATSSVFSTRLITRAAIGLTIARIVAAEAWAPDEVRLVQHEAVQLLLALAEQIPTDASAPAEGDNVAPDDDDPSSVALADTLLERQAMQAEAGLLIAALASGQPRVRTDSLQRTVAAFRPAGTPALKGPTPSRPDEAKSAVTIVNDIARSVRSREATQSARLLRLVVLVLHRLARFRHESAGDLPERLSLRRAVKQAEDRYLKTERTLREQVAAIIDTTLDTRSPDRRAGGTSESTAPSGFSAFAMLLDPGLISLIAGHAERLREVEMLRDFYLTTLPTMTTWRPDLERDLTAAAERCCDALAGDIMGNDADNRFVLAVDERLELGWARLTEAATMTRIAGATLASTIRNDLNPGEPNDRAGKQAEVSRVLDRLRSR
ncbi:MAG: hypothetical protein ACOC0P_00535, partial [Planctomycetota bacterium]